MSRDILKEMREQRQKLETAYEAAFTKRDREIADSLIWGAVGGAALLADVAFLGGLGTFLAAMSGAVAIKKTVEAKQFKKKLKKLDVQIKDVEKKYLEQGLNINEEVALRDDLKKELTEDFSLSAQKEISTLKDQMDALKKELESVKKENDTKMNKPKYDTPKDMGEKNQKGLRRNKKGGTGQTPSSSS